MGVVSDQAKALVKLSTASYLNVNRLPDLFHFMYEIGNLVGCRIGLKKRKLEKKWRTCTDKVAKTKLKIELSILEASQLLYRKSQEQINKTIHPFGETDVWQNSSEIEQKLLHNFTCIGRIANELSIKVDINKAAKITAQIPAIAHGVENWIVAAKKELASWVDEHKILPAHRSWFETKVLPLVYWKMHLSRTPAKARNANLRAYYKKRVEQAETAFLQDDLTAKIKEDTKKYYFKKGLNLMASFQRSSSQVEGRNGYLSFIHHAHKGIPKQRLQVLTVVHNFDTRRADKSTPAERLFQRDFPNLFEFICQNVTGFAEPRRGKCKSL